MADLERYSGQNYEPEVHDRALLAAQGLLDFGREYFAHAGSIEEFFVFFDLQFPMPRQFQYNKRLRYVASDIVQTGKISCEGVSIVLSGWYASKNEKAHLFYITKPGTDFNEHVIVGIFESNESSTLEGSLEDVYVAQCQRYASGMSLMYPGFFVDVTLRGMRYTPTSSFPVNQEYLFNTIDPHHENRYRLFSEPALLLEYLFGLYNL